jgi:chromosome segregation ATPase
MDKSVAEAADKLSAKCVAFLLKPEALDPYRKQITEQQARVPSLAKVTEAQEVEEALAKSSSELEMLTAIVSGLKIQDATETTRIIEGISTLFAQLNQVRSVLRNRRNDLAKTEGAAQFQAQLSLLSQSVLNYLEVATTPEKCDESLTRVLVQIEEMETRFSDFDDYAAELVQKREEVQTAFESRRQSLSDALNRRCGSLGNRRSAFSRASAIVSPTLRSRRKFTPGSPPMRWWRSCAISSTNCASSATACARMSCKRGSKPCSRTR